MTDTQAKLSPYGPKPAGAHQPSMHGYDANAVIHWSPDTDPHAKYFRSRVPLAKRIPAFAPTQAKPGLSPDPQLMNLSADYDKANEGYKYSDTFTCNLLKFWQYTDYYGSWHGLPVPGSPEDDPEYGVVNLPNPAYTDAAHRNGVLSLGCWFWPRNERFADWLERRPDGTFPAADKLIEMAGYFGFDGYFINQEARVSAEDAAEMFAMFKYMRKQAPEGFHLQIYDAMLPNGDLRYQNQFNEKNAPWLLDSGEPVLHSMFVNYAWNEKRLEDSREYAESLGLDPYHALFPGTENDKYGYNPPYDTRLIFPEKGTPRTSWAVFGTDFVWNRYANKFDPNDQEEVYRRERRYWSGPLEDPTDPVGRTLYEPYPDPFHAVNPNEYRCWDGVAHYITERSIIGSYPFVTRFNTGHGRAFYLDGVLASAKEWNNASIQDILPTWQWWVKSLGDQPPLEPSYDYDAAYNGGSSLKITGSLGPDNATELRLFKTKLAALDGAALSVTYRFEGERPHTGMKVGLIFEDRPETYMWLDVGERSVEGWNEKRFNLAPYAGRTIAAIGLGFESKAPIDDYTIHIGELAIVAGEPLPKPEKPAGFAVERCYASGTQAELFLSWDFKSEGIWYYELCRRKQGGAVEAIGRIYDECYYIKALDRLGEARTTLELSAVGFDGTASEAASTPFDWPEW
ncbi:endo-beta-N-acetylglucosaminidase [Paenibacillus spongiae]|uniref:Mannosyl-glycoprotein endo-beta-N-acetylglucosaminidase n=1 Tax=Paenibacillus spongiae TaxID=2909671 RepID=A0ABY5SBV5_9BACL|nr:hypothetical protein [Paenibacillus spongiae]UVI30183.1 hypothetical protein L1F29_33260 [Paenibacillus spongiae]